MREVAYDDSLQSEWHSCYVNEMSESIYLTLIDRLVAYYSPTLHKITERILYLFAKPRETPQDAHFVLESSAKTDAASFTLLNRLQAKGYQLEHLDIAAECLDHMAAGIDTTGDGLCFLMWELSQPSSLGFQRQLREELRANPEANFDKLPYLDAVVMEGLRCFPPIPMSLPRYVPRGGRDVEGHYIPEGTIVSCQAYSVHRLDQRVFPEPNIFNPERWLQRDGDAERRRLFFAFANGGRGCIGKQ